MAKKWTEDAPALTREEVRQYASYLSEKHKFSVFAPGDPGLSPVIDEPTHEATAADLMTLLEKAKTEKKIIAYLGHTERRLHIDPFILHPNGRIIDVLGWYLTELDDKLQEHDHTFVQARPYGLSTAFTETSVPHPQTSTTHCGIVSLMFLKQYLKDDAKLLNNAIMVDWRGPSSSVSDGPHLDEIHAMRNGSLRLLAYNRTDGEILIPPPEVLRYSQSSYYNRLVRQIVESREYIVTVPPRDKWSVEHRSITLAGAAALGVKISRLDGLPLSAAQVQDMREDWLKRMAQPKNDPQREKMYRPELRDDTGKFVRARLNDYAEYSLQRARKKIQSEATRPE